ncbi:hypothetical protein LguiA_016165 [Lonicera macranthoides]
MIHDIKSRPFIEPPTMTLNNFNPRYDFESRRDAYGFTVRPQHLQRYREYANIYKEEEEERSGKWKSFLEHHAEPSQQHFSAEDNNTLPAEVVELKTEPNLDVSGERDDSSGGKSNSKIQTTSDPAKELLAAIPKKTHLVQTWEQIRESLGAIEKMMSFRVKNRNMKDKQITTTPNRHPSVEGLRPSSEESEEKLEEKLHKNDTVDDSTNTSGTEPAVSDGVYSETFFPWKEELEFLVHGGVPRDLRGEVWQAFVGVRARRVERYYEDLLAPEFDAAGDSQDHDKSLSGNGSKRHNGDAGGAPEKWKKQIEKDLPRTFPGHPALNENGRNSLRRLLVAYARHNPSVGYCQAMNFFAGLLLLMMPEENAFWTLVGIMDDYFDGYFSEEMIESQVDQLVFEDLMRERFPKLVSHLDYLGVQVAWLSGPWFLSIYVNMLPWESVLRIWDVLLFEGNRIMLFRTALALMELYGPAVVTTKDAGDAITLLQNLVGSTFDSSQLVLTACMGFLTVTEDRLQQLREKHRPDVVAAAQERAQEREGARVWKSTKRLASKLYSFKHDKGTNSKECDKLTDRAISRTGSCSSNPDVFLSVLNIDSELDSMPDLQEQVVWLKVEMCRLLEEKRAAILRAEELETALMEMVEQDNRRQLSAKVEQLEQEVAELRQTLVDKKEQENVMLQVLMRVEQDQKVTEDARVFAEQDAAAQRYAVHVLQEKYEKAMGSLAQMEKRVVMAESMLEATIQYNSGQVKAVASPGSLQPDSPKELPKRSILSFGLGWRDRNKGKPSNVATSVESKSTNEAADLKTSAVETNGHQDQLER